MPKAKPILGIMMGNDARRKLVIKSPKIGMAPYIHSAYRRRNTPDECPSIGFRIARTAQ